MVSKRAGSWDASRSERTVATVRVPSPRGDQIAWQEQDQSEFRPDGRYRPPRQNSLLRAVLAQVSPGEARAFTRLPVGNGCAGAPDANVPRICPVSTEVPAALPPGGAGADRERIGKYEIVRVIARGGTAIVYEALDPDLGRRVAIKVLREGTIDRLRLEATAAARLHHPNIVTVHEVGPDFIVMDYIPGRTLAVAMPQLPLAAAGGSSSRPWPARSTTPTARGSSTATSSRATSSSRPTGAWC